MGKAKSWSFFGVDGVKFVVVINKDGNSNVRDVSYYTSSVDGVKCLQVVTKIYDKQNPNQRLTVLFNQKGDYEKWQREAAPRLRAVMCGEVFLEPLDDTRQPWRKKKKRKKRKKKTPDMGHRQTALLDNAGCLIPRAVRPGE